MLLYTLKGPEEGVVKEWDRYGAQHALATGHAREATPEEVEQYELRKAALTQAAAQLARNETPEEPAAP